MRNHRDAESFSLSWPDGEDSVEYRYPNPHDACWYMCSKVSSVQWGDIRPLSEAGRRLMLERFGLMSIERDLPLEVIRYKSPCDLMAMRRGVEAQTNVEPMDVVISDRCGAHISAELAA